MTSLSAVVPMEEAEWPWFLSQDITLLLTGSKGSRLNGNMHGRRRIARSICKRCRNRRLGKRSAERSTNQSLRLSLSRTPFLHTSRYHRLIRPRRRLHFRTYGWGEFVVRQVTKLDIVSA